AEAKSSWCPLGSTDHTRLARGRACRVAALDAARERHALVWSPAMAGTVRIEREGPIGYLVFDYPERRNPISYDMWLAIRPADAELAADDAVRVVVLGGAGDVAFISGADISEFEKTRSGEHAREYDAANERAFAALFDLDKPLITAIHGFCVGGGVAIALTA